MTTNTNSYERFLSDLVGAFVEHPDLVRASAVPWPRKLSISVEVAPSDFGSVCGKGGKMFNSLRTLLLCKAAVDGDTIEFRLVEPPARGVSTRNIPDIPDTRWGAKQDKELGDFLVRVLDQCFATPASVEISNTGSETIFTILPAMLMVPEVIDALHTVLRAVGRSRRRKIVVNAKMPERTMI